MSERDCSFYLLLTRRDTRFQHDQGHVQAHTGAQRFATVSGLNNMFPGNGVQWGLRYIFSCLVGVSKNASPISSNMYKPRGIKETARTMGPRERRLVTRREGRQLA